MAVQDVFEDGKKQYVVSVRREDCDEDATHQEIAEALEGECEAARLTPSQLTPAGAPVVYLSDRLDDNGDLQDIYMLYAEKK